MFNNVIYFIIVLLIFNTSFPDRSTKTSLILLIALLLLSWFAFALYCRYDFSALHRSPRNKMSHEHDGLLAHQYQRLIMKFSILAILLFALDVYVLNLRHWLQVIPGFKAFSVLEAVVALALFFVYLCTLWYCAFPAYEKIYQSNISRASYVKSNIRLNLPILFPWFVLVLILNLAALTPWGGSDSFLNSTHGQLIFFAVFLTILMVFLPAIIKSWWGCKPLEASPKTKELEDFLKAYNFRFRGLLTWPIFEGKMMTAGIMGIVPRYRYILITNALMNLLSIEELKAVLAHEMGHAKYRHLLLYVIFFVGFVVVSTGLFDVIWIVLAGHPFFLKHLLGGSPHGISFFYIVLAIPMLMTLLLYFRFVMGFFMRHFERQADLFSAKIMQSPNPTISSLEKIALLSGEKP